MNVLPLTKAANGPNSAISLTQTFDRILFYVCNSEYFGVQKAKNGDRGTIVFTATLSGSDVQLMYKYDLGRLFFSSGEPLEFEVAYLGLGSTALLNEREPRWTLIALISLIRLTTRCQLVCEPFVLMRFKVYRTLTLGSVVDNWLIERMRRGIHVGFDVICPMVLGRNFNDTQSMFVRKNYISEFCPRALT